MTVNSVRLSPEIEQRLEQLAIRLQRSKSDLIRRALLEYFERHGREAAPAWAQASATGQPPATGQMPAAEQGGESMPWSGQWPVEAQKPAAVPLIMRIVSSAA